MLHHATESLIWAMEPSQLKFFCNSSYLTLESLQLSFELAAEASWVHLFAIYQNVGATYVTLPYLTLQMIPAETASLLTDDNNRGFEKFGNSGLHGRFVL